MNWFGLLWLLLILLAFILGMIYVSTANMMGHEVAKRSTRYTLNLFLLLISVCFLLYLLGDHGFVGLQFFCTIAFITSLPSWYFRKQKAGILLLDIGKNEFWVTQVFLGLTYVVLVGFKAEPFFRQVLMGNLQYVSVVAKISDLAF